MVWSRNGEQTFNPCIRDFDVRARESLAIETLGSIGSRTKRGKVAALPAALLLSAILSGCAASGDTVNGVGSTAPTGPTAPTAPTAQTATTASTVVTAPTASTVVTAPTAPAAPREVGP